jgi:hypothetical protein
MLPYEERLIAFDSNVLTYFLDGNSRSPLADGHPSTHVGV